MQIQKGLVKYKDRSDIVCTYGITEDGRQYYFLDGNTIENGNIIASTVLVEAIDPVVPANSIGLIDSNGNIVIPFENKSIKVLSNNLLLVEKTNPTTPTVLEAISLRSDPLAATKLVTTSAAIKEKMNTKMGAEGRFVFNDQFSEATICDINGNNVVNGEYFSFIGMKGETLFFSKNTAESEVLEMNLAANVAETVSVQESENVVPISEEVAIDNSQLDVQSAEVSQEVIDNAMNGENEEEKILVKEKQEFDMEEDITAKNFETGGIAEEGQDTTDVQKEEISTDENNPEDSFDDQLAAIANNDEQGTDENGDNAEAISDEENITDVNDAIDKAFGADEEENSSEEVVTEIEDTAQEVSTNEEANSIESEVTEASENQENDFNMAEEIEKAEEMKNPLDEESKVDDVEDSKEEESGSKEIVEEKQESKNDDLMSFDFGDNIHYDMDDSSTSKAYDLTTSDSDIEETVSSFNKDLFEMDLDNDIFADSKLHADTISMDDDRYDYSYRSSSVPQKDTIIEDAAVTLSNLIKLNKGQRKTIISYEEKLDQLANTHRKVVEKARGQIREIESLKTKVKNYETIVTKLEAKNEVLESKVHDQDRIIATQNSELETLRPQVEGKKELVKLLADAQSLLGQDGYTDEPEDSYMKMMAA